MFRKMKRMLSLLLAAAMVFGMIPISAANVDAVEWDSEASEVSDRGVVPTRQPDPDENPMEAELKSQTTAFQDGQQLNGTYVPSKPVDLAVTVTNVSPMVRLGEFPRFSIAWQYGANNYGSVKTLDLSPGAEHDGKRYTNESGAQDTSAWDADMKMTLTVLRSKTGTQTQSTGNADEIAKYLEQVYLDPGDSFTLTGIRLLPFAVVPGSDSILCGNSMIIGKVSGDSNIYNTTMTSFGKFELESVVQAELEGGITLLQNGKAIPENEPMRWDVPAEMVFSVRNTDGTAPVVLRSLEIVHEISYITYNFAECKGNGFNLPGFNRDGQPLSPSDLVLEWTDRHGETHRVTNDPNLAETMNNIVLMPGCELRISGMFVSPYLFPDPYPAAKTRIIGEWGGTYFEHSEPLSFHTPTEPYYNHVELSFAQKGTGIVSGDHFDPELPLELCLTISCNDIMNPMNIGSIEGRVMNRNRFRFDMDNWDDTIFCNLQGEALRDADLVCTMRDAEGKVVRQQNLTKEEGGYYYLWDLSVQPGETLEITGMCLSPSFIERTILAGDWPLNVQLCVNGPYHGETFTENREETLEQPHSFRLEQTDCGSYLICDECGAVICRDVQHRPETQRQEPGCMAEGWVDEVCAVCGEQLSHTVLPATGHTAQNGVCTVCGAECLRQEPSMTFARASVALESSLAINFYVRASKLEGYTDPYVVFSKESYDPQGNVIGYETVRVEECRSVDLGGSMGYMFTFSDLRAPEMGSNVTATLYALGADGYLCEGATLTYSVAQYAKSMLTYDNAALRTLMVNLLNYGAAAQAYFNYNTANPVNATLTEEQRAYGTEELPELTVCTEVQSYPGSTVGFHSATLILEDRITVRCELNLNSYAGSPDDLVVRVTYLNPNGELKVAEFDGSCLQPVVGSNGKTYYSLDMNALNTTELRSVLTFRAFNKLTDECVSKTLLYSVESYAANAVNGSNAGMAELMKRMMLFGDAAEAFFCAK